MKSATAPKGATRPRSFDGHRVFAANKVGGKGKKAGEVLLLASPGGYLTAFVSKGDGELQLTRFHSDFVAAGFDFKRRSHRGF